MDIQAPDTLRIIEEIGEKFTSATGQSISFIGRNGQWKGPLNLKSFTHFCRRVICNEDGYKRCSECNLAFEKTTNNRIDIGQCHMGVSLVSVPVTIQEKDFLISYGQFLQDETREAFFQALPERCMRLGLEPKEMEELAKEFEVLSHEELMDRIELLRLFSNYVNAMENELQARNQYYREFQEKQELENRLSLQCLKSQTDQNFMIRSLTAIMDEARKEHAERTERLLGDLLHILILRNELTESEASPDSVQSLTQEVMRFQTMVLKSYDRMPKLEELEQSNKAVMKAILILQTRWQEDLSLPMVAKELFLAPSYLSRIFKQETGKTFKEYLTEIRMKEAHQLLQEDITVNEVAHRVGYHDASYFTRVYKKHFGYTPKTKKS